MKAIMFAYDCGSFYKVVYEPGYIEIQVSKASEEGNEVSSYLAEHPEALVDEPVPEPPTQEQLDAQEMQQLLAYLASTDWYASRKTMTGKAIPADVLTKCEEARTRISEIRELLA